MWWIMETNTAIFESQDESVLFDLKEPALDIKNNSRFLNFSYKPISLFTNILSHKQQELLC